MKPIKILIFMLAFLCGKAQSPYFNKFFKLGYNVAMVQNLLKLKDSSFIAFAIVNDSLTGRQDCGFLKLDKEGNEISKKVINFQNVSYMWQSHVFSDMVQVSSSSFIKLGVNFYDSNPIDLVISKHNTLSMDTIQAKYFSDAFHYYCLGILKLRPNKLFLIGTKTNISTSDYFPNLIEMDSSLNFVASYNVTLPITNSVIVSDAKLNESTKKIVLSGWVTGVTQKPILITIDTIGNYSNSVIDNTPMSSGNSQVLYSSYDDTFITIGLKTTGTFSNNSLHRLYVSKYDANLAPVWRKTFGSAQFTNNLFDGIVNSDGTIVVSGMYADSVSNIMYATCNTNGVLLKINSNGDSLWMRQFDNYGLQLPNMPYDEMLKGIEKTSDGGYIACGLPYYKTDPKVWVIRVDSMGCFNANCTPSNVGINESQLSQGISIYPNPASDRLYIKMEELGEWRITISDMTGKSVKIWTSQVSEQVLNIEGINSGSYIISIQASNSATYYRTLIIAKDH